MPEGVLERSAHKWPTGSTPKEKNPCRSRAPGRASEPRGFQGTVSLPDAMASASAPETPPVTPARAKWSRWRKAFAVIGALILVFVAVDVAFVVLDGLPP